MILVACTDDPGLIQTAQQSRHGNPGVFGNVYQIFAHDIPQLGAHENLFIIAYGVYAGDGGNPAIGDERNAFYVDGQETYGNIAPLLPVGYDGHIYVDACDASDHNAHIFSYTEALLTQVAPHHGRTRVFGRNGLAGGLIPLPTASGWTQAH